MNANPFHQPQRAGSLAVALACAAVPAAAQIPNTLLHTIPAPSAGAQSFASLGYSVALEGDFAVVGVPYDDTGGYDCGVVKVFNSTTGALLFEIKNPSPHPDTEDNFGTTVAISGSKVAVTAPYDSTEESGDMDEDSRAGSVYIYDLSSGTPTLPMATLHDSAPDGENGFGGAVAISGTRVVVGAPADNTGNELAGSIYIYDLSSGTPELPVVRLYNPDPWGSELFGAAMAISGSRLAVGCGRRGRYAHVYDISSSMPQAPVAVLENPGPSGSDDFGASIAIFGERVVVGASKYRVGTREMGTAYVYDLASSMPSTPVVKLNNPAATADSLFGYSVAISGVRVVVGAVRATTAGRAYVYDVSGSTPAVPVITLNNPSPAAEDLFGWSVAITGSKVLVGACQDDLGASDAGTAYVYDLTRSTPATPVTTLNSPGPSANDNFGNSLALSGNLMAVGEYGSAHIYDLAGLSPTVPAIRLQNPSPAPYDGFGYSVAMSGRVAVVGASTGQMRAGITFVYDLATGTPNVPVVTINNPSPAENDLFGSALAISGMRMVIGARGDDTGAADAGSAYVYDLSSSTPGIPVTVLNNPTPEDNDRFASSVAISGTRIAVGAAGDDTGANAAGTVYIYDLTSSTPSLPVITLNNPSPEEMDLFGARLAMSAARLIVTAPFDSTGGVYAGSAYVYDLAGTAPSVPQVTLINPAPTPGDYFGTALGMSGSRVVIGVHLNESSPAGTGIVQVFDLESATPAKPEATLRRSGRPSADQFGNAVAVEGAIIAVGAPGDDQLTANKGSVFVFAPHPLDQDSDALLDSWESTHFGTITGHSAADDFDHDGYNELLELALGLNPTISDPGGLPPVTKEGGYLTMTITKQPGVTYEVQSAGTVLPALPDSFSAATTTVLVNDATTLKVRDNFLIGTTPTRFLRVKVIATP